MTKRSRVPYGMVIFSLSPDLVLSEEVTNMTRWISGGLENKQTFNKEKKDVCAIAKYN